MRWIKLHTGLLDWEWHDMPEMISLWIHLLMAANYEDKKWRGMVIPRGSFVTSLSSLTDITGISTRTLRTCLQRLKNTGEIEVKVTNKYSLITINKYDSYQVRNSDADNQDDTQLTSNRQATDKQLTTTLEYKNIRDIKENILSKDNIQKKVEQVEKAVKKVTCKKVEYETGVRLTEDEHSKLEEKYGADVEGIIHWFSLYKQEKHYSTKSDYLAILRWVADAYYERQQKQSRPIYQPQPVKSKAQENYEERQRANMLLQHLHDTGQL